MIFKISILQLLGHFPSLDRTKVAPKSPTLEGGEYRLAQARQCDLIYVAGPNAASAGSDHGSRVRTLNMACGYGTQEWPSKYQLFALLSGIRDNCLPL